MKERSRILWLIVANVAACDGREITVFEVPAKVGGAGGGGAGGGGLAGNAGTAATGEGGTAGSDGPRPEAGSGGTSGGAGEGVVGGGAPEGGGGSSDGGTSQVRACETRADCDPGWRCAKAGCDAAVGVCEPRPVVACSAEPEPVCGCDGVTYWNECVLRSMDVTQLALNGECRATARRCEVGPDCATPYAFCNHLLAPGELCGHGAGTCWVLPLSCNPKPQPGDKRWRQCLGPEVPLGPCVSTCTAIESQRTHIPAHRDDPCQ